jgi:hypothetical protein
MFGKVATFMLSREGEELMFVAALATIILSVLVWTFLGLVSSPQ